METLSITLTDLEAGETAGRHAVIVRSEEELQGLLAPYVVEETVDPNDPRS